MKCNSIILLLSASIICISCEQTQKDSDNTAKVEPQIKYERYVQIGAYSARIHSYADGGREVGRIPAKEVTKILDSKRVKMGQITGTWYKIKYRETTGWISEFATMEEIIEREVQSDNTQLKGQ